MEEWRGRIYNIIQGKNGGVEEWRGRIYNIIPCKYGGEDYFILYKVKVEEWRGRIYKIIQGKSVGLQLVQYITLYKAKRCKLKLCELMFCFTMFVCKKKWNVGQYTDLRALI